MRYLVTGAGGYIGNAIVKRLTKEGHDVVGMIHNKQSKNLDENVKYVVGDIVDFNSLKNRLENFDIVFHCAAYVKDYGPKKLFYKINYDGIKNIVKILDTNNIKKFIYLGHINYESRNKKNFYSITKQMAEQFLINKYKQNGFPVVVIRPGNVYGPNASNWVLRPIRAIKKKRISLIDDGGGIFHHTYIDNLLDALIATVKKPGLIGEIIDITDGDNDITWKDYFNDLAIIVGENSICKNISKNSAITIGKAMLILNKMFKIEPWITPSAVDVLTNKKSISIKKAIRLLNYYPRIDYTEGINMIRFWYENSVFSYIN
jgi:nucleoside-diphosphate-sugar epimerase